MTVRVIEKNKELFKPLHYGPNASDSEVMQACEIEIQLEGQHYQPKLADSDAFKKVESEKAFMQKPPVSLASYDPSLKDILVRVQKADEQMLKEFSDHKDRLKALVDEGQLDKEQLLTIYIKGLNKPDNSGYLAGRIRQVGMEYGNQDFFARAIDNVGSDLSIRSSNSSDVFDVIIVEELVHAIARAMATTHDLSPDEVYAQIEENIKSVAKF